MMNFEAIQTQSIDPDVLELRPGFLGRSFGTVRSFLSPPVLDPSDSAETLTASLASHLPHSQRTLARVSAHYALLSMRHPYRSDAATYAYPLFLLAAWIWDDVIDTNKGLPEIEQFIEDGMIVIRAAVQGTSLSLSKSRIEQYPENLWNAVLDAAHLLDLGRELLEDQLPTFRPRIDAEVIRFFGSFAQKHHLTHGISGCRELFFKTRAVCVGMQPCYEMSYAVKAHALGVDADHVAKYSDQAVARRCAHLATLHCAAVNDLFSMYKDRTMENTANFPSILAPQADLRGYFDGALSTVEQVRKWYTEFRVACDALPEDLCRRPLVETWEHMMEGNARFHLLVTRYARGVELLRGLIDPTLDANERYRRFEYTFRERQFEAVQVAIG